MIPEYDGPDCIDVLSGAPVEEMREIEAPFSGSNLLARRRSSHPGPFRTVKRSTSSDLALSLEACQGDWRKTILLLEKQITSNRLAFESALQQKEEELRSLRLQYHEQEASVLEIVQSLGNSFQQSRPTSFI